MKFKAYLVPVCPCGLNTQKFYTTPLLRDNLAYQTGIQPVAYIVSNTLPPFSYRLPPRLLLKFNIINWYRLGNA